MVDLIQKVKKAGKNLLISGLLVGALTCGYNPAKAKETIHLSPYTPPPSKIILIAKGPNQDYSLEDQVLMVDPIEPNNKLLQPRKIRLDITSPMHNFDSNANAYFSLTELLGRGLDITNNQLRLDETIPGRISQAVLATYLQGFLAYISHETAHNYLSLWDGNSVLKFSNSEFTRLGPPKTVSNMHKRYGLFDDKGIFQNVAGLNQLEFNATKFRKNTDLELSFDQAIVYLQNELDKTRYAKKTSNKGIKGKSFTDDIDEYLKARHYKTHRLRPKSLAISREELEKLRQEFFIRSLATDLANIRLYESVFTIANYLATGERSITPLTLNIGNTQITPPQFSHYLTPNGEFVDINFTVNPRGEHPIDLSLGTDLDFLTQDQVNTLRFGGKINNLHLDELPQIRFSPFAFASVTKNLLPKGFLAGTDVSVNFDPLTLNLTMGFARDDILENDVKGRDSFILSAGIESRF